MSRWKVFASAHLSAEFLKLTCVRKVIETTPGAQVCIDKLLVLGRKAWLIPIKTLDLLGHLGPDILAITVRTIPSKSAKSDVAFIPISSKSARADDRSLKGSSYLRTALPRRLTRGFRVETRKNTLFWPKALVLKRSSIRSSIRSEGSKVIGSLARSIAQTATDSESFKAFSNAKYEAT